MAISKVVYEHDIPSELVINLDQTPLFYITPGKYTFNIKGANNVPVKGIDDKRQITATFAVSAVGVFLPMQLIYTGKTNRCLPNFEFPHDFNLTYTRNHWSNLEKAVEHFEQVIFPFLQKTKEKHGYPKEQMSLVIMDAFKGQDNIVLKELCTTNFCEIVIVPHNLTNKFQPLDISVNKAAKSFISEKYNTWMANQLKRGISPCDVKVALQLGIIKPLHAKWIVELYTQMQNEQEKIVNGFRSAGITEAIQSAGLVLERIENPFHE